LQIKKPGLVLWKLGSFAPPARFSREGNAGILIDIRKAPFLLSGKIADGYFFPLGGFLGRFEYSNPFVFPMGRFFASQVAAPDLAPRVGLFQ
jgi:hypothetical protein